MKSSRSVAILLFDDVEVLDFAGPFEVFSVAGREKQVPPFRVCTVAEKSGSITARHGLSVNPTFSFGNCPQPDLLVIPGGIGTRALLHNEIVLDWLRQRTDAAELVLSICTGSLLLGKAGLLNGLKATTHFLALDLLRSIAPAADVQPGHRVLDNGRMVVAAGVSAGIDASFHVIGRLLGKEEALAAARYIEYDWRDET